MQLRKPVNDSNLNQFSFELFEDCKQQDGSVSISSLVFMVHAPLQYQSTDFSPSSQGCQCRRHPCHTAARLHQPWAHIAAAPVRSGPSSSGCWAGGRGRSGPPPPPPVTTWDRGCDYTPCSNSVLHTNTSLQYRSCHPLCT